MHTDLLHILAGRGLDPEAAQRLVDEPSWQREGRTHRPSPKRPPWAASAPRRGGKGVRPRPTPRPRPQRQGQDHALGPMPEPQDREGQALWQADGQVRRGAECALVAVPQSPQRRLLSLAGDNRRSRGLQPRHRRDRDQGVGRGGAPDLGPPDPENTGAMLRPAGRGRLALAGGSNEQWLQLQRPEMLRVQVSDRNRKSSFFFFLRGRLRRRKRRRSAFGACVSGAHARRGRRQRNQRAFEGVKRKIEAAPMKQRGAWKRFGSLRFLRSSDLPFAARPARMPNRRCALGH